MLQLPSLETHQWLQNYKTSNAQLLDVNPDFRQWLEEEYVPIRGAWQY
jgi:hypothetical protein